MKFVKLLSVILVLALTVSMALPVAADGVEVIASGQCGENAYWKLDEDGILFITGNGSMYDFTAGSPAPWAYLYNSISAVIISSGITTIGSNTFWCPNPFGQFVFANITIPRSVSYIDPTAFQSCPYLQEVYFGDTYDRWVTLIENTHDELLQCITLHASDSDVNMCGIYTQWKYNDGTLTISGNGPMMDWSMYSYTPWDLSRECTYTTKIVVEQGVTHVGNWAFEGLLAKELILANSVVSVGNYAFKGCDFETAHLGSNLTWIGESAFEGCDSLLAVTLPSTLTTTGPFAFRGCTKLLSANLGGLTTLSQEIYSGSSNLIAVYIPSSVSSIEYGAFYKSGLQHIFYEGSAMQWQQICDKGGNEAVTNAKIQYNTDMDTAVYYLENIYLLCDHDYCDWTNEGSTHNRICRICSYTDAIEHSWDEGKMTREPKCDYGGTATYKCTICDATKEENIEKLEHVFGPYKDKTGGMHRRTCSVCFYDEVTIHIWDTGKVTIQPTCKTYGKYQYTCTMCSAKFYEPIMKLTTHTYNSANDTQCDICGYVRDLPSGGDETASHTWNSGAITKKANCKEEGVKTYTCTTCNATKTESIAKLTTHTYDHACDTDCNVCSVTRTTTHNYKTSWSGDITNHWHECSVCKDKKDVAAHELGAEANATTAQTCTICGYEIAPALGVEETTKPTDSIDSTIPSVPIDQNDSNGIGFPVWIVIVVAIVAIGGVAALVVIKKRRS